MAPGHIRILGKRANCMGYALEYDANLDTTALGIDINSFCGKTIDEVHNYCRNRFDDWMDDYLGSNNFAYIPTYNSGVYQNWFKAFYVVTFTDNDHNDLYTQGEPFGYHWYYQTDTGIWASKLGSGHQCLYHYDPTIENLEDPLNLFLQNGTSDKVYRYGYYQIRDIRNVSWSY